jgi:glycerophosphoryl diester phosphodiesterase
MEAFQHAVSSGTNMLEMDVVYTKDKKVTLFAKLGYCFA